MNVSNFLFICDMRLQFHFCEYSRRIKLAEGNFYMDINYLRRKTTNIPITFRLSKCYELLGRNDEDYLYKVIKEWRLNTLALYRGFPGCHFCWSDLVQGELKSEGTNDYPDFTMNGTGKGTTRWLPAADVQRGWTKCPKPKNVRGQPAPETNFRCIIAKSIEAFPSVAI